MYCWLFDWKYWNITLVSHFFYPAILFFISLSLCYIILFHLVTFTFFFMFFALVSIIVNVCDLSDVLLTLMISNLLFWYHLNYIIFLYPIFIWIFFFCFAFHVFFFYFRFCSYSNFCSEILYVCYIFSYIFLFIIIISIFQ